MTNPPKSLPFKILRIAGIGFLAVLVLIAGVLVAGKIWVEHHFLRHEIHLGENTLHVYGGDLDWSLRFRCDSIWYRSPALQARLGNIEAHLWFPLAARVHVDTAFIRLINVIDTASPHAPPKKSGSAPVFPTFKIPVRAVLKIRALTLENDSGELVSAWNISVRNPGMQDVRADVGIVSSPFAKNLSCSVSTFLDWSSRDSVDLEMTASREKDQIHLQARNARADLLRGRGSLQAQTADSRIYTKAFGVADKSLPYARDAKLEIQIIRNDSLEAHALLQSQVQGFPRSLPLDLSPQKFEAKFDWLNRQGQWKINSRGKTREELSLQGALRQLSIPADDSLTPLWQHFAASAQGYARNFRVHARGKTLLAEVRVEKAQWDGKNLFAQVGTGDSSQAKVEGSRVRGNWSGKFSLRVNPNERWIVAFVDTNVSFAALQANGTVQGKTVIASLTARKISAYGVHLDSLSSSHVYGPRGYELKSSSLYARDEDSTEETWSLSGKVEPAKPVPLLDFSLESLRHGSLEFLEGRDQFMHVTARHFEIGALPYAGLAKLPVKNPVVDGTFEWNIKRHSGAMEARIAAEFQKENVQIQARSHWDAQYLDVEKVRLDIKGSSLNAHARLHLKGKQFYEVAKLRIPDYESVGLETNRFDLAHALSLFQPQPVLKSGEMQGSFSYVDGRGFEGSLVFSHMIPAADVGDVVLKRLQIDGTGDTLIVTAATTSETTPLLKDSLRIAVTHVLESSQQIRVDAMAADSLHLHMEAVSTHLQSLQGRLQLQGRAPLPENSGLLDRLHVDLDFSIPFQNVLEKATLTTRIFEGDYSIPPTTREHFSLNPTLAGGTLKIPQVILKDEKGRTLRGEAQYAVKGNALHAKFSGGDFAMQWTEDRRVALQNLNLECFMDSTGMRLTGGFSQGSVLYVDPPLHTEGDLKAVTFAFSRPSRSRARVNREPPSLEFYGSLSQSLLRYRIKSFSALQDFFKKEGNKKRGGRTRPIRLDVKLHTIGDANHIDSDILRFAWVGDLEMHGIYPFTLVQGRINALNGELGLQGQAYQVRQLEVKWLNAPLEEGEAHVEARKNLARTCDRAASTNATAQDSCTVIAHLQGPLDGGLRLSYDTDCGGAYGAGASMAALAFSVVRGCYDASFSNGGGAGYEEKALSILEPQVNRSLSSFVGRHSYSWIEQTEVSGLSSLAGRDSAAGDSLSQALSLQVTSREFLHFRLKLRSGYHTESQELSNPWENMVALEWRPPLENYVESPEWKQRLDHHVSVAASVRTLPVQRNAPTAGDPIEKMVGLNYAYDFWGSWWNKPAKMPSKAQVDSASKNGEKLP